MYVILRDVNTYLTVNELGPLQVREWQQTLSGFSLRQSIVLRPRTP